MHLNYNPIETIVGGERLVSVKDFYGGACALDDVPRGIESLPALEIVSLERNNLTHLPARLMEMASLGG